MTNPSGEKPRKQNESTTASMPTEAAPMIFDEGTIMPHTSEFASRVEAEHREVRIRGILRDQIDYLPGEGTLIK